MLALLAGLWIGLMARPVLDAWLSWRLMRNELFASEEPPTEREWFEPS